MSPKHFVKSFSLHSLVCVWLFFVMSPDIWLPLKVKYLLLLTNGNKNTTNGTWVYFYSHRSCKTDFPNLLFCQMSMVLEKLRLKSIATKTAKTKLCSTTFRFHLREEKVTYRRSFWIEQINHKLILGGLLGGGIAFFKSVCEELFTSW